MADNSSVVGALRVLLTADSAQFETTMKSASAAMGRLSKDFKGIGTQLQSVGGLLTKTLTVPLVGLAATSVKAAIDFESSFAGVRKTVNATEVEFQAMAKAFRDLSKEIPVNVNELNRLGEAAGALGIPKQEIVGFVKVMAELGVTTNVTSDQAATSIAKIQTVFQSAGQETDRFASTLVDLGNKGASTEDEILSLASRLASAGVAVGLSQAQVLGFSAALANVGIEAEAGGTAMSRVFADMSIAVSKGGESLGKFAAIAGVSTAEFSQKFKTDAAGAVTLFIEGLGKAKNAGGDLNLILDKLGFTEVRQARALRDLALSGDNLATSLRTAVGAWRENSALSVEAGKRFETTEAKLTLLWNRIKDVGITIGNALLPGINSLIGATDRLLPIIEDLAKAFTALPGWVQGSALGFVGLAAAVGPVTYAFGKVFEGASTLIGVFGKKGIALRALTTSYEGLGKASAAVGGIWGVGVAGAALAAAYAADKVTQSTQEAADAFKRGDVSAEGFGKAVANAVARGLNPVRSFISDLKQAYSDWTVLVDAILGRKMKLPDLPTAPPKAPINAPLAVPGLPKDLKEIEQQLRAGLTPAVDASRKSIEEFRAQLQGLSENDLSGLKDDLASGAFSLKDLSEKYGISTNTVKLFKEQLKDGAVASREANQAARDLAAEQERLIGVMEQAGVMTGDVYVKKLGTLVEVLNVAAREGTPALQAALASTAPEWAKFIEAARQAGFNVSAINDIFDAFVVKAGTSAEAMAAWERSLPILPVGTLTDGLKQLGLDTDIVATRQQVLTDAYAAFGLKAPQVLQKAADAAVRNYQVLLDSGTATTTQLKDAYAQMIEAQRAATGTLPSAWDEMLPRITGVVQTIGSAVQGTFSQMLLGAKGFKDGFLDIWHSIKAGIGQILTTILQDFTNRFLKGLLGMMAGQQGAMGKAFGGLFGGGGGMGGPGGGLLGKIPGVGGLFGGGAAAAGGAAVWGLPGVTVGAPVGAIGTNIGMGGMGAGGAGAAGGGLAAGMAGGLGAGAAGVGLGLLFQKMFGGAGAKAAVGGGLSGAASGALIGSIVPGLGTAIGALIGGLSGVFGGLLGKSTGAKANDTRDAAMGKIAAQFGGTGQSGTGAGSDFALVAAQVAKAAPGQGLFEAFLNAKTPEKVQAALAQIALALDAYAKKEGDAKAAEEAHAAAIADITAKYKEKTDAINAQQDALGKQLADINASEAPEKHMGSIEKAQRESIARQQDALAKQLQDLQEQEKAALAAIGADVTGATIDLTAAVQALVAAGLAPDKAQAMGQAYADALTNGFKGTPADFMAVFDQIRTGASETGTTITADWVTRFGKLPSDLRASCWDPLDGQFTNLVDISKDSAEKARLALLGIGKDLPPITVNWKYRKQPGDEPPDIVPGGPPSEIPGHATGWIGNTPHVAMIAEGGETEMVGSVGFMAKALEGALGGFGGGPQLMPPWLGGFGGGPQQMPPWLGGFGGGPQPMPHWQGGFGGGPQPMPHWHGGLHSVTIMEIDKREIGRAVADVLPGELRRLGVRVRA